jgi:hypothetical protein
MHFRQLFGNYGADKTRVFLCLVAKMSDRFLDQRIDVKFCAKLGKNKSETCTVLSEVCQNEVMEKSSAFVWHKRFKEGRKNVADERSCRSRSHRTDENVEKVPNLVHSDRRLIIRHMAAVKLNLDKQTVKKT